MMVNKFDLNKIKFLESTSNLKRLLKEVVHRETSSKIAQNIAVCLQQGRLFYEAAALTPLEIRPLQIYYGMLGFSKALILALKGKALENLKQSHGIRDTSAQNSKLEDLRVKIESDGTFQQFNDCISTLNRICYFAESNTPTSILIPSSLSNNFSEMILNFKEILSRIPSLAELYYQTFSEHANTSPFIFNFERYWGGFFTIRIDDSNLFNDRTSLKKIVCRWRARFPLLNNWRIIRASHAWGYSVIEFQNIEIDTIDEFSEEYLQGSDSEFAINDKIISSIKTRPDIKNIMTPVAGGYSDAGPNFISPINDVYFSEFSLQYLGVYLLSSVVRYRPTTWIHAVSRGSNNQTPADDRAMSLVEMFLETCLTSFPNMVIKILNPYEDKYKKRLTYKVNLS
jgi:hypothetical protein